MVIKINWH